MSVPPNPYRAAGTFSGPSYVERGADRDLLRAIRQHQRYPHVLAPRQSGKSSLIDNVRAQLSRPDFNTAFVDFSIFSDGDKANLDALYLRLFEFCRRSLALPHQIPVFREFIDGVEFLLDCFPDARLVIFLDEVDALLSSPVKDTFFSVIRNVFNSQSSRTASRRAQFVLSGAASQTELIADPLKSPFNVGEAIRLDDLTPSEVVKLASLLEAAGSPVPVGLPDSLFQYTHGSVFLTQLILERLYDWRVECSSSEPKDVGFIVHSIVETLMAEAASNLHFCNIHKIVCSDESMVAAWKMWREGNKVSRIEKERLYHSGLSSRDKPVRCLIYERVFGSGGVLRIDHLRPKVIQSYLERLAEETASLKLLGLGRSLQIELPISEVYVPLRANLSRSMEIKSTERFMEHLGDAKTNVELGDMFQHAKQLGHRGVVLLGEPGSGKTTGARQLAWLLASRQCHPNSLGLPEGITPILLRFRNLSSKAIAAKNGLRVFLNEQTESSAASDGLTSPGDDLWNGRGGPLLWILDGLDEVIDAASRKSVSRWVQEALRERPQDYFFVTSRFAGYYRDGISLGSGFAEFHVRPLDDGQIGQFVHVWFAAAYGKLLLSPMLAESRVKQLLEYFGRPAYQSERIRELCTNPMLLTILCIVFHDDQTLPVKRSELYAHCVRVLLEHWRQGVYQAYDTRAAQFVLSRIAWWMHSQQDRTAAPMKELAEQATIALLRIKPEAGLGTDGLRFLERMKDETGILAADGDGRTGFLHLSFQEFLAAEFAASQNKASQLAQKVADSWWREVALLSLRHSESYCEDFFREMLAAGIAENHPDLADRCLTEALVFAPEPFIEVLRKKEPQSRIAAVLRLLRSRIAQVRGLEAFVVLYADSTDEQVRSVARDLLARMGIEMTRTYITPEVIIAGSAQLAFVRIPAGEFLMGSFKSNDYSEGTVHAVRISKDFLLGKYPVTNAQYAEFIRTARGSISNPAFFDDRRFNQPEQPVVGVSWDDARAFCEWVGCRLPTEAEWEYACRAGTTTEYSFGDNLNELGQYAWYNSNSSGQTQPVGTKQPNLWGLHDMHGNSFEWCQDRFDDKYYSKSPAVDPPGPDSSWGRVLRGGAWFSRGDNCRSAFRLSGLQDDRYNVIGFRVARSL